MCCLHDSIFYPSTFVFVLTICFVLFCFVLFFFGGGGGLGGKECTSKLFNSRLFVLSHLQDACQPLPV